MRKISQNILFSISIFISTSWATLQEVDSLKHNETTWEIHTNPEIEKISWNSSACWRGYNATLQLKNDSLYLVKISDCATSDAKAKEVKELSKKTPLFLSYYSGEIFFPICSNTGYINYRNSRKIKIINGILTDPNFNTPGCEINWKSPAPYLLGFVAVMSLFLVEGMINSE